ncbi:MAG: exo-beta-N-acetylmuramidase NamZ domain-containing protein [Bacillota bacterium]
MRRIFYLLTFMLVMLIFPAAAVCQTTPVVKPGNEVLLESYQHLIAGKRVGLVTNQTGVNSRGVSFIDILAATVGTKLTALYAPEHGLDGVAKAGQWVESYTHPQLRIPVYSLYGSTRMPTQAMLQGIDVLLFDIQDIGARTYTYMSTLQYCLVAAEKYNKPVVVLDRPNPLGGMIVEGPVLEDCFKSFVGVDNLPMAHGMTAGELARFFNRKIGAALTVVPMEGYRRSMSFEDTGLPFVQASPNIPDLTSAYSYMATGLGEGTGVFQADKFRWIGGRGIDAARYAELLNGAGLPGVVFVPEVRGTAGGVRLEVQDPLCFNPAKSGIYALTYAFSLGDFQVPKSTANNIVMFDKVMGTDKMGRWLEEGLTPQQIEARYAPALQLFKQEREQYLLPQYRPGLSVVVDGVPLGGDLEPFIDEQNRIMVPLRAVSEALGAQVRWEAQTRRVIINRGATVLHFTVGSPVVLVNGQEKLMDTIPQIKNSRTVVPLRFAAEYLGATVDWNGSMLRANVTFSR